MSLLIVLISVALAPAILYFFWGRRSATRPYPPGPPPRLFTGNLYDVPKTKAWETYFQWSKTYGSGLVHYEANSRHTVIINTKELSDRMLEQRSRIYSDRPYIPMVDLLGWGPINTGNIHAASVILTVVYGYDISTTNDYFVDIAEKAVGTLSLLVTPAAAIVNIFPVLRRLPLWFPIFEFQRSAAVSRKLVDQMFEVPYQYVRSNMRASTAKPSLLSKLLERNDANGGDQDQEFVIKSVCATGYSAGADTSVSVTSTFFLAMAMHPEVQKKAQEELDTMIGRGRTPGYEERPNLPYIEAIFKETLRWAPALPAGLSRAAFSDDVVDGYYIPKGATIISNFWAIARDESVYPNPDSFIPERFLNEDGTCVDDNSTFAFGAGRRVCPGRHLASASLWMVISSVLAEFDIGKPTTLNGKEIRSLADAEYSDGLIR
ncbi:hypothetical protein V5O48_012841 [Marasmius crinis-equi]|uniref:Cytochrome P450 n=1 Tax=Marasmius crinis-equi TaxID=585013 RepID=A0ABR3F1P8_9AGAR